MAATNGLLAFGGMTQCWQRWGWRMFFYRPSDRAVAGAIDDIELHDLVFQQPQGPARASLRRFRTSQGNQFGLLLAVKNPRNRRHRSLLAAQHGIEALFHQLLACPVDHGWAGLQSLRNLAVTPSIPTFRDIGLEQYPRLQQPLRGALPFPNQRFKPFAFLATQPHHIFLYRNLLCSHDRLRRQ